VSELRVAVFADGEVGNRILSYFCEEYPDDLKAVCAFMPEMDAPFLSSGCTLMNGEAPEEAIAAQLRACELDLVILAWWPKIVGKKIIKSARLGCLNCHPSYLPYNRGKHYNFWTIVEETRFGVTLHFVDEGIDTGDIVFQKEIHKTWLDTGKSLYCKAQSAMVDLFQESYPRIRQEEFVRCKQDDFEATMHYSKELENASELRRQQVYSWRQLLNLIRARTFRPHPACYFFQNGKKVFIRSNVTLLADKGKQYTQVSLDEKRKYHDVLQCDDITAGSYFVFDDEDRYFVEFTYEAEEENP
jgi:methionyl-tRNA formyltransferase